MSVRQASAETDRLAEPEQNPVTVMSRSGTRGERLR